MWFSVERLRRQAEGYNFTQNTMQSNKCSYVSTTDKYRAKESRYLWYCGTKKYRQGDGTGTVEKWYCGSTVVPRNTTTRMHCLSRNQWQLRHSSNVSHSTPWISNN